MRASLDPTSKQSRKIVLKPSHDASKTLYFLPVSVGWAIRDAGLASQYRLTLRDTEPQQVNLGELLRTPSFEKTQESRTVKVSFTVLLRFSPFQSVARAGSSSACSRELPRLREAGP